MGEAATFLKRKEKVKDHELAKGICLVTFITMSTTRACKEVTLGAARKAQSFSRGSGTQPQHEACSPRWGITISLSGRTEAQAALALE